MTNFDLSLTVFAFLKQTGVETLVVCAGARNAPFVMALHANPNFKVFNYFEERSAAFFAVGLIKAFNKPVAVLTTSGTAVAELLPAAIEATYQALPLILITADRPKNYRGTGSPQTIEQVGLFSNYVESVYDLDVKTEYFNFKWSQKKPLHLNVSFDEPLIDKQSANALKIKFEKLPILRIQKKYIWEFNRPLIILGEIPLEHISQVIQYLVKTKAPVYAESLSHLKNQPEIADYIIFSSEQLVKQVLKLKLCDSVVRIGSVPTLRFWRDLEHEFINIPVVNFTDLPFTGLARDSDLQEIIKLRATLEFPGDKLKQIKLLDKKLQSKKENLLKKFPLSEQSLTNQLSTIVKKDSLYLGNSLPIRNWDQFAQCASISIYANRGANGIDGQISTYLGWSENEKKSYCYVGDLTALYDLASLGLSSQLNQNQRNIIVLNNFGGQIFSRVFKSKDFVNAHKTQFQHWAQMWNWNYLEVSSEVGLQNLNSLETQFNIIEVLPNAEQTELFWCEWDESCCRV